MACAALAASNLGFDGVKARLICDTKLDTHVIEINVSGPNQFQVDTFRVNPAKAGAVTGQATYVSFLSSMLEAKGRGVGLFFC